jgi:hypothetical protein
VSKQADVIVRNTEGFDVAACIRGILWIVEQSGDRDPGHG